MEAAAAAEAAAARALGSGRALRWTLPVGLAGFDFSDAKMNGQVPDAREFMGGTAGSGGWRQVQMKKYMTFARGLGVGIARARAKRVPSISEIRSRLRSLSSAQC